MKKVSILLGVLLIGMGLSSCNNPFLKDMLRDAEKGISEYHIGDKACLIFSPDKKDIELTVTTSDGSDIAVEGCTETKIKSGTKTTVHAKGIKVILKGKITKLNCLNNKLQALNVQGCTNLQDLYCGGNQLRELNVQGCTNLHNLGVVYNKKLIKVNAQGCTNLQKIECPNVNSLNELNIQGCTNLQFLYCSFNSLTKLDVQGLINLKSLLCTGNKLIKINVQGCKNLKALECQSNHLTELNVAGLINLKFLLCTGNKLTKINVQGCTSLEYFDFDSNKLTEVNIQGLINLKSLLCRGNKLTQTALKDIFIQLSKIVPKHTDNSIVLYEDGDGNYKDYTQPAELAQAFQAAKAKGWHFYKNKKSEANKL